MQQSRSIEKDNRPSPVNTVNISRSFSRYEPTSSPPTSSPQSLYPPVPDSKADGRKSPTQVQNPDTGPVRSHSDIFETQDDDDESPTNEEDETEESFPEGFDELPIEIQSLMERFLESLSLRTRSASLSVDRLSELYQNFYIHVETQIATHVATLSSRIARERSPVPSISSTSSASSRGPRKKDSKGPERRDTDQQMLTASDMADRKKTRRHLEIKKVALEEAVERGVCEKVYPRLWRHSSTDDGERDAKLRSRAAALAIVGVDLKELLSTALTGDDGQGPDLSFNAKDEQETARSQLSEARESLRKMNEARYPQGKLAALTIVHKNIVDTLSQMFPSTSSADEILPTLIYVIITSSPETISVVSNFHFIERFRNANKLDGEAAYCLTNLEAAISFLATVDLSSIRRDELPEGPSKGTPSGAIDSRPSTPRSGDATPNPPPYRGLPPSPGLARSGAQSPTPPKHPRRLSSLMNAKPNQPFSAAGGAVLNTADTALDTVHAALDNSFKFLFGRLREKQATTSPTISIGGSLASEPATPRTLEDARKLVTEKVEGIENEEVSLHDALDLPSPSPEPRNEQMPRMPGRGEPDGSVASAKMLELISGRRATATSTRPRDGSVGSTRSDGSVASGSSNLKRHPLANGSKPLIIGPAPPPSLVDGATSSPPTATSISTSAPSSAPTPGQGQSQSLGAVEQMRKFGDLGMSLNPLKGFSMRGFGGRSLSGGGSTPAPVGSPSPGAVVEDPLAVNGAALTVNGDVGRGRDEHPRGRTPAQTTTLPPTSQSQSTNTGARPDFSGIAPPLARFVELRDARELNFFEVELLLRDYQRLAGAVGVLLER